MVFTRVKVVSMPSVIGFLIAGAFGSLARDCIKDGKILLPHVEDHSLVLGFIGGMIVGAFVGWATDGTLLAAGLSGYVGTSAIGHLLPGNIKK